MFFRIVYCIYGQHMENRTQSRYLQLYRENDYIHHSLADIDTKIQVLWMNHRIS